MISAVNEIVMIIMMVSAVLSFILIMFCDHNDEKEYEDYLDASSLAFCVFLLYVWKGHNLKLKIVMMIKTSFMIFMMLPALVAVIL